jgi:hypothetical protein
VPPLQAVRNPQPRTVSLAELPTLAHQPSDAQREAARKADYLNATIMQLVDNAMLLRAL